MNTTASPSRNAAGASPSRQMVVGGTNSSLSPRS